MDEEQERAKFEDWAVDEGYEVDRFEGVYTRVDTCDCWHAWKAALSQPEPVGVVLTRMNQESGETKTAPELYPAFADLPARTLLYASQPASPAPEAMTDEQILFCMGGKQPARTSARHGAAIFEYRLFGLIDFARAVLALSQRNAALKNEADAGK